MRIHITFNPVTNQPIIAICPESHGDELVLKEARREADEMGLGYFQFSDSGGGVSFYLKENASSRS